MTNSTDNRARKAKEMFPVGMLLSKDISAALHETMLEGGGIGKFRQDRAEIVKWMRRLPPALLDEALYLGACKAIHASRQFYIYGEGMAERQRAYARVKSATIQAKARQFDRIVELLDHMDVNGKVLGDCTKADLVRAAVKLEHEAGEAQIRAALYRQLADLVGPKGTVRQSTGRGKIVALLTTTFKEAA